MKRAGVRANASPAHNLADHQEVDAMADAKIPPDAPSAQSESRAPVKLTPKRKRILKALLAGPRTSWQVGYVRAPFSIHGHQGDWAQDALRPMRRCNPPLVDCVGKDDEFNEPLYAITPAGLAALREAGE